MKDVKNTLVFAAFGFLAALLSQQIDSDFISKFSESFISLLVTILAINIASASLIASKLTDIQVLAKGAADFSKTKKGLAHGLRVQLILIVIAGVTLLVGKSTSLSITCGFSPDRLTLFINTLVVTIFIYQLYITFDIGKALIQLMEFSVPNSEKNKENQ